MKKVNSINYVLDMFKTLSEDKYSLLWELVEDFEINGHTVSVQRSTQLNHVIIDGVYQSISDNCIIISNGVEYSSLDYVRMLLQK